MKSAIALRLPQCFSVRQFQHHVSSFSELKSLSSTVTALGSGRMATSVEDTGICRQKKVDKKPNSVMPKIRMQYRGDDWAAESIV